MPQSFPLKPRTPLGPGVPGHPSDPESPGNPGNPRSPGGPRILMPLPGKPFGPVQSKRQTIVIPTGCDRNLLESPILD